MKTLELIRYIANNHEGFEWIVFDNGQLDEVRPMSAIAFLTEQNQ